MNINRMENDYLLSNIILLYGTFTGFPKKNKKNEKNNITAFRMYYFSGLSVRVWTSDSLFATLASIFIHEDSFTSDRKGTGFLCIRYTRFKELSIGWPGKGKTLFVRASR